MLVCELSSKGRSVEEGRVDVELYRAEDDELSLWPPLEAELCVPPLPLDTVSRGQAPESFVSYRLLGLILSLLPTK